MTASADGNREEAERREKLALYVPHPSYLLDPS